MSPDGNAPWRESARRDPKGTRRCGRDPERDAGVRYRQLNFGRAGANSFVQKRANLREDGAVVGNRCVVKIAKREFVRSTVRICITNDRPQDVVYHFAPYRHRYSLLRDPTRRAEKRDASVIIAA